MFSAQVIYFARATGKKNPKKLMGSLFFRCSSTEISSGVFRLDKALNLNPLNDSAIYYPSNDGGKTVKVTPGKQLTVIGFCHGTSIGIYDYQYLYSPLISTGNYIVVANTFPYTGAFPINFMSEFGNATFTYIKGCMGLTGKDPVSGFDIPEQPDILKGKVNQTEYKVLGHSLGGGAAIYTAAAGSTGSTPTCTAYVGLSPAQDAPSGNVVKVAEKLTCPSLFLTGSEDTVVPAEKVKQLFSAVPDSTMKYYGEVKGVTHCQWTETSGGDCNTVCRAAEIANILKPIKNPIPHKQQLAVGVQMSSQFLCDSAGIEPFFNGTGFTGNADGTTFTDKA